MEYIDPVNRAIAYIESHLTEAIAVADIAAAAGYSRFHLGRIFLRLVGESPVEYIRKRRLSEASRELTTQKRRILDIALDYQFQSPEVFARSFRKYFGCSPSAYRKRGRITRAFHRLTLKRPTSLDLYRGDCVAESILVSHSRHSGLLHVAISAVAMPAGLAWAGDHAIHQILIFYSVTSQ